MNQPDIPTNEDRIRADALDHISKTRATVKRRVKLLAALMLANIGLAATFVMVGTGWTAQALPTVFVISAIINAVTLKSSFQTLALLNTQEYYINYFNTHA